MQERLMLAQRPMPEMPERQEVSAQPVGPNAATLQRVHHAERTPAALDDLLTQTIAALLQADVITLRRVAQDELRVRAGAGASSFRRKASLERCLDEARAQVDQVSQEHQQADPNVSRRAEAARERAAEERLARAEAALRQLPEVEASKERQRKKLAKGKRERVQPARVSTTDPDARVMKMGTGGFGPAANVQIATDRDSRAVLAVAVSNQGSDGGLAGPLEGQVAQRTGQHPHHYLIDGGLATRDDITTLAERGVTVYAPPEQPRTTPSGRGATDPRPDDSPAVAEWRRRMGSEQAKQIYKERGSTAEWTNAQWRMRHHRVQFSVRGLTKMTTVALLYAVTHNLLRWWATQSEHPRQPVGRPGSAVAGQPRGGGAAAPTAGHRPAQAPRGSPPTRGAQERSA